MKGSVRLVSGVSLGCLMATPCLAQSENSQATASDTREAAISASDIIVTARRRSESLSKVPITITALSADSIEQKSVRNEADLQAAAPGLLIKQSGGSNLFNYVIRGQTIDTYTNSPPGVLPYVNEAQVTTHSATSFYDIAGVQVLKGPQGTLFGRNTTGGAVLYSTQQPTDKFEGYIKARYGNYDAYGVDGAVNVPFGDAGAFRIAANRVGGGAFSERIDTGKRYGDLKQTSVRGTLLLRLAPNLKNTLMAQYSKDGGTNAPSVMYRSNIYRCGNAAGNTSTADCFYSGFAGAPGRESLAALFRKVGLDPATAGIADLSNVQDKMGPWKVIGANIDYKHYAKSKYAINTTEFEMSSDVTLKNIMMINDSISRDSLDYDGSPFPLDDTGAGAVTPDFTDRLVQGVTLRRTRQFSNELQLQGKTADGRLQYTVGGFYSFQRATLFDDVTFFDFSPYVPPALIRYDFYTRGRSYALFGQATYALTDQLNLTGGFRYTWEKIEAGQGRQSLFYNCGVTFGPTICKGEGPAQIERTSSAKPSWNVSIDYRITPELMIYATTRGSWRAGTFNASVAPNPVLGSQFGNLFKPETIKDVEGGLKYSGSDAIGVPLTANFAVYKQWVDDIQRVANVTSPSTGSVVAVTLNVPQAQIWGGEFDMTVRPASWLNLGGSLNYTSARFSKNQVTLAGNPPLFFGPYADVPRWAGSAFVEVTGDLGSNAGQLVARIDTFFQSKYNFSNLDSTLNPGTKIDGYQLVNGRLTWNHAMGSDVSVALYARNIFNKRYYTGGTSQGYAIGQNSAFVGVPRMYGVEARLPF
jgi:iron complex outermembrane receptor protein